MGAGAAHPMAPARAPATRNRSGARRDCALAAVAGLALAASFIDFRLSLLPWLAMAPLIALTHDSTPRHAFWLGFAAGLAGIAAAFVWLIHAVRLFGGFPLPVALAVYLVPVAWMALQFGLFGALLAWMGPLPLGLAPALVFTAVEFVFPSLFPWRLAHTQYHRVLLLQSGDLAGPYLLTFTMVWTSTAILAIYRRLVEPAGSRGATRASTRWWPLLPCALLVALLGYGGWRLASVRAARAEAPVLRVGVVQGNIGVERKGNRSFFVRNLEEYRTLSRAVAPEVDLLVWPETVVQEPVPRGAAVLAGADHPFPDLPRPLVYGGLGLDVQLGERRLFNSAFLLRQDGRLGGRYDKRVLVPFGEYLPLADRFPRLRALSRGTGRFSAGSETTVLALDARARIAPLICYEDVIPGPARDAVQRGATLLLNLTNDAWYGDSAEPLQHQALAAWRAVENRRDLVRATNTGLTSVIAATGEVLAELPVFQAATLATEVRLLDQRTFYTAHGDAFAGTVLAIVLVCLLRRRWLSGPRRDP